MVTDKYLSEDVLALNQLRGVNAIFANVISTFLLNTGEGIKMVLYKNSAYTSEVLIYKKENGTLSFDNPNDGKDYSHIKVISPEFKK